MDIRRSPKAPCQGFIDEPAGAGNPALTDAAWAADKTFDDALDAGAQSSTDFTFRNLPARVLKAHSPRSSHRYGRRTGVLVK
jgi:hypothetical protein